MFFAVWLFVAPFDKVEVEPGIVVATLVSLGGYQELRGEWRMRRAHELSIVHQNQEV